MQAHERPENRQNRDIPGDANAPRDPDFLHDHVDEYYRERIKEFKGNHILKGRMPRPWSIRLCTNDYLALAQDPRIIEAEAAVLRDQGHGEPVSRAFRSHHEDLQRGFEHRMAGMLGCEDAVLCQSGYNANVGLVQCFGSTGRPIYIDMRAHASLWEGIVSARAEGRPFRHNSAAHLQRQIEKFGPGLIIVDAVYSIDGSVCPLADIAAVAEANGCVLVVDETHSFGVQGENGEGLTRMLGLEDKVHFQVVGLSKAVASRGGVVAGSARNMEYFRFTSFPAIFSTQVMDHEIAGYDAALDIIRDEGWRREALHRNHAQLRDGLDALGYNVDASDTQIIAIESGLEPDTIRFRDALEERDVFGSVFCAPATPRNRSVIRFTMNCQISADQIERVLEVFAEVRGAVGMADWSSTRRRKTRAVAD